MSLSNIFSGGSKAEDNIRSFEMPDIGKGPAAPGRAKRVSPFQASVYDPSYTGPLPGLDLSNHAEAEPTPGEVLAEARDEAERLRSEAYDEGLQTGQEDGLLRGQAEIDRLSSEIVALLDSLSAQRTEVYTRLEAEVVELAVAVAEQVIGAEVTERPELVKKRVSEAVSDLLARESVKVRLHPLDVVLCENILERLEDQYELGRLTLIADDTISRGGCLVDTAVEQVDARIESQLGEISRLLDEARASGVVEPEPDGQVFETAQPGPAESSAAVDEPAPGPDHSPPMDASPRSRATGDLPEAKWGEPVKVTGIDDDEEDW